MQVLVEIDFTYPSDGAYNISGEEVNSMICYLMVMGGARVSAGRRNRRELKTVEYYVHLCEGTLSELFRNESYKIMV